MDDGEITMAVKISFADLTHTGQTIAANTVPLGVAMVARYAMEKLGPQIEAEIFRYPAEFTAYLDTTIPRVACFSNFSWNLRLAHEFARRIKLQAPGTITVFGGPNFPTAAEEQEAFLKAWPSIDFYIDGEGELAFVALFEALQEANFDAGAIKERRAALPNTFYISDNKLVCGEMLPRIQDMNSLPSVYLSGLCDKFFDETLIPMMQTSRGCPFSCTFCHEGQRYFNKTRRVSQDRIRAELRYIADRAKVPDIQLVDSNFGMFAEDIDTAKELAALQKERGWPRYVSVATAKNHKERVIEAAALLKGSLPPGASIQTTDENILKIIKRKNLPIEAISQVAATAETNAANSFSEIILCLPGDTKAAHFKSVLDMADAGINYIRMYQFMMLHGTEASSEKSRKEFGIQTKFRVLPRCFGTYEAFGETFPVAEIEEISIANNTMPHEDYLDCRALNLSTEIFLNGGLFADLTRFLALHGISRAAILTHAHQSAVADVGIIGSLYADFVREEDRNLWKTREELEAFVQQPGMVACYVSGEYGSNELYKYRALSFFQHMEELHDLVYDVARKLLSKNGALSETVDAYLSELREFSLMRKRDVLNPSRTAERIFAFDFAALEKSNFTIDPFSVARPDGIKVQVFHTSEQQHLIGNYVKQYGTSLVGLGRILLRSHIAAMYRKTA